MKTLNQYVEEAVVHEEELASLHRPTLSKIRKVFEKAFSESGSVYNALKDFKYYKGGWPNPDSPPKMQAFLDKIGPILKWMSIQESEAFSYLSSKYGVNITVSSNPLAQTPENDAKFEKAFKELYGDSADLSIDRKKLYEDLINRGQVVQADICSTADKITVDISPLVEKEYGLSNARFRDIVRVAEMKAREKSVEKKIEKIEKTSEEWETVLENVKK